MCFRTAVTGGDYGPIIEALFLRTRYGAFVFYSGKHGHLFYSYFINVASGLYCD